MQRRRHDRRPAGRAMGRASQRIIADWGPERFADGLMQAVQAALRPPPTPSLFDQARALRAGRCEDRPAHCACLAPRRRRVGSASRGRAGHFPDVGVEVEIFGLADASTAADCAVGQGATPGLARGDRQRGVWLRATAWPRCRSGASRCSMRTASGCIRRLRAGAGADACRPYLISTARHARPWAVRQAAWKKRVAAWWFENAHLAGAACLHALTEARRVQSGRTA